MKKYKKLFDESHSHPPCNQGRTFQGAGATFCSLPGCWYLLFYIVKKKGFFFFYPFRSHTVPFPCLFLVEPSKETVYLQRDNWRLTPHTTRSDPFCWQSFLMSIPYQSIELLHSSLWLLCTNVLLNHFLSMDILFPNLTVIDNSVSLRYYVCHLYTTISMHGFSHSSKYL